MHVTSEPGILYFGTPVVLISSVNEDGTYNLAPMSSAFWLGVALRAPACPECRRRRKTSNTHTRMRPQPAVGSISWTRSIGLPAPPALGPGSRRQRCAEATGSSRTSLASRDSTCRSTFRARPSSSGSGRPFTRSRPGATATYTEIARRSARRRPPRGGAGLRVKSRCGRHPLPPGGTQRRRHEPATAGASGESGRCSPGRRRSGCRARERSAEEWDDVRAHLERPAPAPDLGLPLRDRDGGLGFHHERSMRSVTPRSARSWTRRSARVLRIYRRRGAFRSRVVMARHGFGRGEYQYFAYPLPDWWRTAARPLPAPRAIANRWSAAMGLDLPFPRARDVPRALPRGRAGEPTPLLLRYGPGDYNCLHQDLYGEHVFPLQVAVLLSEPGEEFAGGEFVLAEQRPRMQSRAEVVPLRQGEARDLPGQPPAGPGHPRYLPGQHAPRRQPAPLRPSLHARHHLPRCHVSRGPCGLRYFSAGRVARRQKRGGSSWSGQLTKNQRKTFAPRCKSTVLITPGIQPGRASKIELSPTETAGCNLSA